ncbi:hypothetical protein [Floricoccus penangensis]|uniref:hypothetical protein n=1 Tax=Floricoccus penangensis TaxID=1859475 RepID=UPI00203C92F8|nr:hypothetical protein [Floricoccus penangensis]URZ87203.1 hypothetical protein KIW23_08985 [Floricoccus penangensis]
MGNVLTDKEREDVKTARGILKQYESYHARQPILKNNIELMSEEVKQTSKYYLRIMNIFHFMNDVEKAFDDMASYDGNEWSNEIKSDAEYLIKQRYLHGDIHKKTKDYQEISGYTPGRYDRVFRIGLIIFGRLYKDTRGGNLIP